jgi:hypothetical protein
MSLRALTTPTEAQAQSCALETRGPVHNLERRFSIRPFALTLILQYEIARNRRIRAAIGNQEFEVSDPVVIHIA